MTLNGHCSRCGGCCPDILPVTVSEVIVIKKYITARNITPIRQIEFDSDSAPKDIRLQCPFSDEAHKKCLIYQVRPEICRTFICSQTPEVIAQNQIDLSIHRKGAIFVSMHITFLDDRIFTQLYQNQAEWKNREIAYVKFKDD